MYAAGLKSGRYFHDKNIGRIGVNSLYTSDSNIGLQQAVKT